MTVRFDLLFLAPDLGREFHAHVVVKTFTRRETNPWKDAPVITPAAATKNEFDGYTDNLQKELEEVRTLGHKEIRNFLEQYENRLKKED